MRSTNLGLLVFSVIMLAGSHRQCPLRQEDGLPDQCCRREKREYKIRKVREPRKCWSSGGRRGLEAARVAALRGHAVTLWKKEINWAGVCWKLLNRA